MATGRAGVHVERAHGVDVGHPERVADEREPLGRVERDPVPSPGNDSSESIVPSGFIREMKPLLSFAVGLPLMFET